MLNLSRRCVGFLRSLSLRGCKSVGDGALRYCSQEINYLLTSNVRSLRENLKPRPCRIDLAIAWSIRQGRGLRFSRKDRLFEVNKLFIIWLFAWLLQACNRPVGITGE